MKRHFRLLSSIVWLSEGPGRWWEGNRAKRGREEEEEEEGEEGEENDPNVSE